MVQQKLDFETKIVTPTFRVSYPFVFEARLNQLSKQLEFSLVMLFDKKTAKQDLLDLRALCQKVAVERWKDKIPANLRNPFRDGDLEKADNISFKNMIFVTSKSKFMPGLVDQRKQPILNRDEFYGGCYARAQVNVYSYSQAGNNGVNLGLLHIQKVKDGQPFGNRTRPEDAFAPIEDAEIPDDLGGAPVAAKGMFD